MDVLFMWKLNVGRAYCGIVIMMNAEMFVTDLPSREQVMIYSLFYAEKSSKSMLTDMQNSAHSSAITLPGLNLLQVQMILWQPRHIWAASLCPLLISNKLNLQFSCVQSVLFQATYFRHEMQRY